MRSYLIAAFFNLQTIFIVLLILLSIIYSPQFLLILFLYLVVSYFMKYLRCYFNLYKKFSKRYLTYIVNNKVLAYTIKTGKITYGRNTYKIEPNLISKDKIVVGFLNERSKHIINKSTK